MELVAGKAVHGGLLGFIVGAGFETFKAVDVAVRTALAAPPSHAVIRGAGSADNGRTTLVAPALQAAHDTRGATLTRLLSAAARQGGSTAAVLAFGATAAGSVSLARHGRFSDRFYQLQTDPAAAAAGAFAASYVLFDEAAPLARVRSAGVVAAVVAVAIAVRGGRGAGRKASG
jgi:hypothetical protein